MYYALLFKIIDNFHHLLFTAEYKHYILLLNVVHIKGISSTVHYDTNVKYFHDQQPTSSLVPIILCLDDI